MTNNDCRRDTCRLTCWWSAAARLARGPPSRRRRPASTSSWPTRATRAPAVRPRRSGRGSGTSTIVPELREAAMASRESLGGHLADREWMTRVLDETHARMDELADVQRYPFPVDAAGRSIRDDLQGPEYMRRQRLRVQRLGVRILDHTPAVELLVDDDGVVSGAAVLDRASGRTLRVEAAAVVLAAGGCAFQSKTLGCDVNTGDGALMAVEAGASLSGMEFSNAYAIAVKGTSLTKTAYYSWATFYRADKTVLEGAGSTRGRSVIAKTLLSEAGFRAYRSGQRRRAARDAQRPTQLLPRLRPAGHQPVHRLLRNHAAGRRNRTWHRRRADRRLRLLHRCAGTVCRR